MNKFTLQKEQDLAPLCRFLKDECRAKIFLLRGELASGKTTLVKYFAAQFGIKDTSSPTFSVMNNYADLIYHYDIYQKPALEFLQSGLADNFAAPGFHFIEWADENIERFLKALGLEYRVISITRKDEKREITLA